MIKRNFGSIITTEYSIKMKLCFKIIEYLPKLWNIYTLCLAWHSKTMEFIRGKCY